MPSSTSQSSLVESFGDDGVVVRPADARRRLVEDDRLFRNRQAGLGSVVGIVEPDGDEIADSGDAGADPRIALDERQLVDRRLADLGEPFGRERIPCDVGHHFREVADATLGVDDAGLFTAARAEADELHGALSPRSGKANCRQGEAGIMRRMAAPGKQGGLAAPPSSGDAPAVAAAVPSKGELVVPVPGPIP